MKVSFERLPGLGLRIASFRTALLLETVTIVPARAMLRPLAHAHPAELVATLPACHVVTPSILLDGGVTVWAFLCVGRYPVRRLRVVLALLDPFLH